MSWPSNTADLSIEERDGLITNWLKQKELAEAYIEAERNLRQEIVSKLFPNPRKGTNRYELPQDYALKLVNSLSYTLGDKDKVDDTGKKISIREQVEKLQDQIDLISEVYGDRLIRWKPEIVASEYEKLSDNNVIESKIKALIDELLTIKPAMPQLSLEEPKKK